MNLDYSESEQTFREEVQNFIRANIPATIKAKIDAEINGLF